MHLSFNLCETIVLEVRVVCDGVMNVKIFCHSKTFKHSSVILSAQYIGEEISREREDKDERKAVENFHKEGFMVVVEVMVRLVLKTAINQFPY